MNKVIKVYLFITSKTFDSILPHILASKNIPIGKLVGEFNNILVTNNPNYVNIGSYGTKLPQHIFNVMVTLDINKLNEDGFVLYPIDERVDTHPDVINEKYKHNNINIQLIKYINCITILYQLKDNKLEYKLQRRGIELIHSKQFYGNTPKVEQHYIIKDNNE